MIPWIKIKSITFAENKDYFRCSMIGIIEHNKKTHYLSLNDYLLWLKPKKAIKATREFIDDERKIKEIKYDVSFSYEWGVH